VPSSASGSPIISAASSTDLDLADLARDVLERWTDAAIKRNIDLGYDGPEDGPAVHGEPQLLRELIGNLVDYAIRYGRPAAKLHLGFVQARRPFSYRMTAQASQSLSGSACLNRSTARPRAAVDGCGLGLAIAREIAACHGARLFSMDHIPRGTRVEVVFGSGQTPAVPI
jgi:two-component system sensor histidine kinase TctE